MIQSMTGFAERSFSSPALKVKVTLKSLNHRFLDWSYKGAPLGGLENRLKSVCQRELRRGRVEAGVEITHLDASGWDVFINEALLVKLVRALERAAARSHREVRVSVDNVLRVPNVVEMKPRGLRRAEEAFLVRCFELTLGDLARARRREGRDIARQLRGHLIAIRSRCGRLERRFRSQERRLAGRLREKLRDPAGEPPPEEKVAQETALQSQRLDITEEIARLKSHLGAVGRCLSARSREPQGRMLDFLTQELLREANTINAKSQDLSLIQESLAIKGEVESIRQQVQNLE